MDTIPQNLHQKQCKGPCGRILPATSEYFHAQKKGKYGFRSTCKLCRKTETPPEEKKAYNQRYLELHREENRQRCHKYAMNHKEEARIRRHLPRNMEKHRQQSRDYARKYTAKRKQYNHRYYRENFTQVSEQKKAYNKTNEAKIRERRRSYYEINKEAIDARSKLYYRTHKIQHRAHGHAYRARKRAAKGRHTAQDIQRQLNAQRRKCYWCGKRLDKYEVDHIVPLSRGGSNEPSNLVIACPPCNNSKHNKLPHEWPQGGRLL